jgi:hypothetical protein
MRRTDLVEITFEADASTLECRNQNSLLDVNREICNRRIFGF